MDGTGLTRQRIHQIIKNRAVPVVKTNRWFLLKWADLVKLADNASILNFLKNTLDNERKLLEKAYEDMKENEKAIQFAKAIRYAMIVAEGAPAIDEEDRQRITAWLRATSFFNDLSAFRNPATEEHTDEDDNADD